jgi:hypothetical protein
VRDSFAASESPQTPTLGGGRLPSEWVAGLDRNGWPTSVGTGGRIASESVAGLARITQADIEAARVDPLGYMKTLVRP